MTDADHVLDGWLLAFARDGWAGARLDAVADLAGVTGAVAAAICPDRWSALDGLQRRLDIATLADAGADRGASVRDRLFALLMARFDAGEAHKDALRVLAAAARRDPGLAAYGLTRLAQSAARIADAAGVETTGFVGPLRVQALALLCAHVARTWLDDGDPDLAATMKALDGALERAERWAGRFTGSPATPAPADDPAAE